MLNIATVSQNVFDMPQFQNSFNILLGMFDLHVMDNVPFMKKKKFCKWKVVRKLWKANKNPLKEAFK